MDDFFAGDDLNGPDKKPCEPGIKTDMRISECCRFVTFVIEMPNPGQDVMNKSQNQHEFDINEQENPGHKR
jgi:hypothetical protein